MDLDVAVVEWQHSKKSSLGGPKTHAEKQEEKLKFSFDYFT